jgi:FlgD Ig-like domain
VTETVNRSARAAFALLVVATVAAFFVTQRLKTGEPVVKNIVVQAYMSPNRDSLLDRARMSFTLPHGDRVTLDMDDPQGDRVRRLLDGKRLGSGRHTFTWDGLNDSGVVPRDGHYYLRVVLRDQGRAVTSPTGVLLLTHPPRPRIVSVSPRLGLARRATPVTVRFVGPAGSPPVLRIWRTDRRPPALVATVTGRLGTHVLRFGGRVGGRPLPPGDYSVSVTVRNVALVQGSFPPRLPPARLESLPGTGFSVIGTVAAGPLEPVAAGGRARLSVEGGGGPVRWRLVGVAAPRTIAHGRANGPVVGVRIPRKAESGEYVAVVTQSGRTARVPLTVRAPHRRRVLLVIPTMTWQGMNPVDDDADGFADTLFSARSVPLARPFARGKLPAGLTAGVAPLLRFLDARGLRYEVTTDLALARGHGPLPPGHAAVVLAGPETWTTARLAVQLQAYARSGGHILSLGVDSLQRAVVLTTTALEEPTRAAPADAFGEGLGPPAVGRPAALVASSDRIGLFAGTNGVVGSFIVTEPSRSLPRGARSLAAAGREGSGPALVAYRLGRGMVIRIGTPGWARLLDTSPEVASVTERAWALISR